MENEQGNLNSLSFTLYANFGLAYFQSECLHRELCNFYMLKRVVGSTGMTRRRTEEIYMTAVSMTLGKIIDEVKPYLEQEMADKLDEANGKRNYMAHHFWFDKTPQLFNQEGVRVAIEELREYKQLFSDLDEKIREDCLTMSQSIGVTEKVLSESLEEVLAGTHDKIEVPKRKLEKCENIVAVYDVQIPEKGATSIFESEDGMLWQLCDVGLGWSSYQNRLPEWKVNDELSKYLPFPLISRPKSAEKWDYEFDLAKGARLWVKKDAASATYRWGIRKA
jgi:hypothetical protein